MAPITGGITRLSGVVFVLVLGFLYVTTLSIATTAYYGRRAITHAYVACSSLKPTVLGDAN